MYCKYQLILESDSHYKGKHARTLSQSPTSENFVESSPLPLPIWTLAVRVHCPGNGTHPYTTLKRMNSFLIVWARGCSPPFPFALMNMFINVGGDGDSSGTGAIGKAHLKHAHI